MEAHLCREQRQRSTLQQPTFLSDQYLASSSTTPQCRLSSLQAMTADVASATPNKFLSAGAGISSGSNGYGPNPSHYRPPPNSSNTKMRMNSNGSGGSLGDYSNSPSPAPSAGPIRTQQMTVKDILAAHDGSPQAALAYLLQQHNALLLAHVSSEAERARVTAENTKVWSWCTDLKRDKHYLNKENERNLRARQRYETRYHEARDLLRAHGIPIPNEVPVSEDDDTLNLTGNLTTPRESRRPSATRSHSDHSGDFRESADNYYRSRGNPVSSSSSSRTRQMSNQSTTSTQSSASYPTNHILAQYQLAQSMPHSASLTSNLAAAEASDPAIVNSASGSEEVTASSERRPSASEKTPVLRRKASSIDLGVQGGQGLLSHPSVTAGLTSSVQSHHALMNNNAALRSMPSLSSTSEVSPRSESRDLDSNNRSTTPVTAPSSNMPGNFEHSPMKQFALANGLPNIINSPFAPMFPSPQQRTPQAVYSNSPHLANISNSHARSNGLGVSISDSPQIAMNSDNQDSDSRRITTPVRERESFLPDFTTPSSERSFVSHSSPVATRGQQPSTLRAGNGSSSNLDTEVPTQDAGSNQTGSPSSGEKRPRASSAPLASSPHLPQSENFTNNMWSSQSAASSVTVSHSSVRLVPAYLTNTKINVVNSNIKTNDRSREVISFTIQVHLRVPDAGVDQSWAIEKKYSDVLTLDNLVKTKNSRSQNRKIANLPDKSLFKDHAPSKVDLRKSMLQRYLQSLTSVPLQDKTDICFFLQSNVLVERNAPVANPAHKSGFLTKKGRLIGGWQTRFYTLQGPFLQYYESQGGAHLGQIDLAGAQIGRQQNQAQGSSANAAGDSYRHAFLIREARQQGAAKSREEVDHILCAESDKERDEWVKVLAAWYTGDYIPPLEQASASSFGNTQSVPNRQPSLPTHPELSENSDASPLRTLASAHGPAQQQQQQQQQQQPAPVTRKAARKLSRDDIGKSIQQSNLNPATRQSVNHTRADSAGRSSLANDELTAASSGNAHRLIPRKRNNDLEVQPSSSLPSNLDAIANGSLPMDTARPASEQGQYSEPSPSDSRDSLPLQPQDKRPMSPDRRLNAKISGPINGAPIGAGGFKQTRAPEERRARVKSSFWNFAVRADKQTPIAQPRPVFGVPLAEAVAVARIREGFELPAVVFRCVEYLEAKSAANEEGLYRLSGSANVIKALRDRFNHEGDINLLQQNEYYDVHAIAGLLKLFLRELPVHVLTKELQPQFLQVCDLANRKDRVNELGTLVAQLPVANYTLLRFLTAHLMHVVQNEKINKMGLRNIGIVFSPSIAIPATLFTLFLTEFNHVFRVLDDQPAPLRIDDEVTDATTRAETTEATRARGDATTALSVDQDKTDRRRSRNSVYYSNSGANALLELHQPEAQLKEADEDSEDDQNTQEEEVSEEEQALEDRQITITPVQDEARGDYFESNIRSPSQTPSDAHQQHDYQRSASNKGLSINVSGASVTGEQSPTAYLKPHSPHGHLRPQGLPASPRAAVFT